MKVPLFPESVTSIKATEKTPCNDQALKPTLCNILKQVLFKSRGNFFRDCHFRNYCYKSHLYHFRNNRLIY